MHELAVTRTINAPTAHVWQIMTEQLAEWWCPKPWTTEIVRLDRRAGGVSNIVMHGPNGEEHQTPGLILAWSEGHHFAFTDAIAPGLIPAEAFMIGIWAIEAEGDRTRYTAVARHWTEDAMQQHLEMGFHDGWSTVAEQLQSLCEQTAAEA